MHWTGTLFPLSGTPRHPEVLIDRPAHRPQVAKDLARGEFQHTKAQPLEKSTPAVICFGLAGRLAPDLDHERLLDADEIHDEGPQRMLAMEAPVAKGGRSQQYPQAVDRVRAQATRKRGATGTWPAASAATGCGAHEETPQDSHEMPAPADGLGRSLRADPAIHRSRNRVHM